MVLSQKGCNELHDVIIDVLEQIFILERDLYGQYRFDKRGDRSVPIDSDARSERIPRPRALELAAKLGETEQRLEEAEVQRKALGQAPGGQQPVDPAASATTMGCCKSARSPS
jgi:hypothetical protein